MLCSCLLHDRNFASIHLNYRDLNRMETAMSALPSLLRFFAIVVCLVWAFDIHAAAAAPIGKVTKAQNQAQVGGKAAAVGTPVKLNDRLLTGAKSRMEVTFVDGTKLNLGENARVVVDRYVYDPSRSTGAMALDASRGALRLSTGKLNQMSKKDVKVSTPYAALAVRGTEFWMGPIDGHYGALLLKGKVDVRSGGRTVKIRRPKHGIDIPRRRRR